VKVVVVGIESPFTKSGRLILSVDGCKCPGAGTDQGAIADHHQMRKIMALEKFRYDNKIVRYFAHATIAWGIVAFLVGLVIALQLISPFFNFKYLQSNQIVEEIVISR